MIIPDSISLEEVSYSFNIEYDDYIPKTYIKNENLLDILGFLWENIVLEVPLHFTKVRDLSKFHGDGWKLISEDELIKENNPFTKIKQPNKTIMILKEASVNFNNIIPKTTSNTTNNIETFNNLLYLSITLFIYTSPLLSILKHKLTYCNNF